MFDKSMTKYALEVLGYFRKFDRYATIAGGFPRDMFFNKEAYRAVRNMCAAENPDIFQGFGVTKHLSPSLAEC